ncbi:MAG: KH domain-containing protein [Coriobacteriales bacterium]|jgi:predicted RNA-binding protein YlqC (UPF0109 family)
MPRTKEATGQLVEMIVRSLVDDQDSVSVVSKPNDAGIVIEVSVSEEETGKIIGRQGRIIKAIRALARASADFSVDVEVLG